MNIGDFVTAVRSVTGPGAIALSAPDIGAAETRSVMACVEHGAIGYDFIEAFQKRLALACSVEQCVAVSSGTAALQLALMAVGVQPGDEVLMPTLTFVGTANAAVHAGGIPHFVDSREYDLGVHPFKLRQYLASILDRRGPEGRAFNTKTGRPVGALIVVHLLGHPAELDAIRAVTDAWGIPVVEDAAQALGSSYLGRPCGGLGAIAAVSFNNNKLVTTNGGGAVLTNDPMIAATAWNLATTARVPHPFLMAHDSVAFNYRMGNVNAALGLSQLERIEKLLRARREVHRAYGKALRGVPGVDVFEEVGSRWSNYWLTAALMTEPGQRDAALTALTSEGVSARALFTPLHLLPMYAKNPRSNCEGAMDLWRRTICLPSGTSIGESR